MKRTKFLSKSKSNEKKYYRKNRFWYIVDTADYIIKALNYDFIFKIVFLQSEIIWPKNYDFCRITLPNN